MRRIYESSALHRDDDEPFSPTEAKRTVEPQAFRSIDSTAWSDRLIPHALRHRAISVDVSTPRDEYPADSTVPFTVTMKNGMPVPITITTASPILWTWCVDGLTEASHVSLHDPPDEKAGFRFDRGERKRFRKRWEQSFQVSDDEWEPAPPGEYTIGAGLNVEGAAEKGLYDETTVRIGPASE